MGLHRGLQLCPLGRISSMGTELGLRRLSAATRPRPQVNSLKKMQDHDAICVFKQARFFLRGSGLDSNRGPLPPAGRPVPPSSLLC